MLAITQFEVYVHDQGRWTLHARYGSDQRQAAVTDARTTEYSTGLPTKVVCETYFPEINESELVTAYISPKARELREEAKARRKGRSPGFAEAAAATARKQKRTQRARLGVRQFVLRGIVAAAFSLVAATLTTMFVSWALKRMIEAGVNITPALTTGILTYAYALLFLFYFFSLFRSRLPLHKLFAYLWQRNAPATADKPAETRAIAAEIAPRLRPKNSAAAAAEAQRAVEALKVMRGDLPPEPEAPAPAAPPPVAAPAADEAPRDRKARAKEKEKEKERAQAEKAAAEQAAAERAAAAKAAREAADAQRLPPDALLLERTVLRRFVAEVVRPATHGVMPDDPVTRRGAALVIAGAVAALADTTKADRAAQFRLIEDALTHLGASPASAQMFMHQYDELTAAPANAPLLDLGRAALAKHLEGADVARMLTAALIGWRTPYGQTLDSPAPHGGAGAPQAPHDVYLLTELRIGAASPEGAPDTESEAARDAAMGLHNSIVRSVLGTHAGHEVKHTGTGIFARFGAAGAAVGAAAEIQRRFTAGYGARLVIALIADTGREDPLLSPALVHRAQAVVAQAQDGETLAEQRVRSAAGRTADGEDAAGAEVGDGAAIVRLEADEEDLTPALYEHSPATPAALAVPAGPFG